MICKQFEVWIADLNPQIGTEAGKIRPVVIVQTDFLNKIPHLSTLVCPITTNITVNSHILRVPLKKGLAGLHEDCDIMMDQIRAIDNKRLVKKIGNLPSQTIHQVKENILIMFDIEI
jgi:mRNA interferase MazF